MSKEIRAGYIGISAEERKLIELIRESEETKQIVEDFIFGSQKSPTGLQAPSGVQETSP